MLYADDMVILAYDDEMLRRAMAELGEWCVEWSVKVDVDNWGVMHMRKKGVKQMGQRFVISGAECDGVQVQTWDA